MKRKAEQLEEEEAASGGGEYGMFNHGVAWRRGPLIGKGGFGSVYLAELKNPKSRNRFFPSVMAVKSAEVSVSSSLQKEKEVFNSLNCCPYILKCFGEETTISKDSEMVYNVLLEYACGGTLSGLIKKSNGVGLPELDVRRYTRCILEGIDYIHREGYVHCDLKPENILLVGNSKRGEFVPKIGDFGLTKKSEKSNKRRKIDPYLRGTALYLAPETVVDHVQEPPSDIWALGCIVFEMLTGKPAWDLKDDITTNELLRKIGDRFELPKIPAGISKEGKDFLKGCLVRKPMFRLTAEMLLDHPFVSGVKQEIDCEEMLEISDVHGAWPGAEDDDDVDEEEEEECSTSYSSNEWSFTSVEDFSVSSWSVVAEEGGSTATAAAIAGHVDAFKPLAQVSSKTVPKFPPLCSVPAGA